MRNSWWNVYVTDALDVVLMVQGERWFDAVSAATWLLSRQRGDFEFAVFVSLADFERKKR